RRSGRYGHLGGSQGPVGSAAGSVWRDAIGVAGRAPPAVRLLLSLVDLAVSAQDNAGQHSGAGPVPSSQCGAVAILEGQTGRANEASGGVGVVGRVQAQPTRTMVGE